MRFALLITSLLFTLNVSAQITQTIRGTISDAISQRPLPGASVVLLDTTNFKGAATDLNGDFRIDDVPIGKVSLKVSFIGYEDQYLQNLVLSPSKQLVLNIQLQESINKVDVVVVRAERDVSEPLNEMAMISARTFSVEETRRFAGSW